MKKIIFLLLLIPMFSFAQEKEDVAKEDATTEEEYNYLTQGYKLALETGADMKAGYTLKHLPEKKINNYSVRYSFLKETVTSKTKAVLITLTKDKDDADKVVYLCLPFNNSELLKKFYKEGKNLGVTMAEIFNVSMFKMLSTAMYKATNNIRTE